MMAPAIAPPDKPLRCSEFESESPLGATIGVVVTVCVTIAPDSVTTRTLVTGDGVAEAVVDLLDVSVVAATGAINGVVVPLGLGAYDVDKDVDVLGKSEVEIVDGVCAGVAVSNARHVQRLSKATGRGRDEALSDCMMKCAPVQE